MTDTTGLTTDRSGRGGRRTSTPKAGPERTRAEPTGFIARLRALASDVRSAAVLPAPAQLRHIAAVLALAVPLALGACAESPLSVSGPERFDPPAQYRTWAAEVETCAQDQGVSLRRSVEEDFSRIRWLRADDVRAEGDGLGGAWKEPNTIYVLDGRTDDRFTIKHEVLHWMIQSGDHPEPPFEVCTERTLK